LGHWNGVVYGCGNALTVAGAYAASWALALSLGSGEYGNAVVLVHGIGVPPITRSLVGEAIAAAGDVLVTAAL
jgi:hypothetical protein